MATRDRKLLVTIPGLLAVAIWLLLAVAGAALIVALLTGGTSWTGLGVAALVGLLLLIALNGFIIVQPNQAKVATFLGRYMGTVRTSGFYWINPLTIRRNLSLRIRNLDTDVLKVNDANGNPIEISAVITWQVSDAAERVIATLLADLQERLEVAGIAVLDTRLRRLAYAPEIAADMLRRQQADAIVAARQRIVEGAVGMVDHALSSLSERDIVDLDEERKAAMVSNLMWAADDLRSVNAQIEFLLRESLRRAGRLPPGGTRLGAGRAEASGPSARPRTP